MTTQDYKDAAATLRQFNRFSLTVMNKRGHATIKEALQFHLLDRMNGALIMLAERTQQVREKFSILHEQMYKVIPVPREIIKP